MSGHPTRSELHAVLLGELSPERRKEIFAHLLMGCEECRSALSQGRRSLHAPAPPLSPEEDAAYDAALDRAFEAVLRRQRRLRRERPPAEESALLDAGSPVVLAGEGAPSPGEAEQVQVLLARSWAARHDNPRAMVSLARCALVAARSLDPRLHGEPRVADLQARAWGELGNALRGADDLDEAEGAFEHAFSILPHGTGDELLESRLRDLRASFYGARQDFQRAFEELDAVQVLYRSLGDGHLTGRVLVKKAVYLHYAGRSAEALRLNEEGMALIDESREPGLAPLAVHNQLWFLVACGHMAAAKRCLVRERSRLRDVGHVLGLRVRWLEGRICLGLAEWDEAETALREACQGFEAAGMGFNAALVLLDLALLRMHQGRSREAAEQVTKAAGVFRALRTPREALAAVLLLEQAFAARKATLTLLETTVEFLRRSEADPQARYVPRF